MREWTSPGGGQIRRDAEDRVDELALRDGIGFAYPADLTFAIACIAS
jgi:hypothetical protein